MPPWPRFHCAFLLVACSLCAGCVWSPGETENNSYYSQASYQVTQTSERSVDGTEHLHTTIGPNYYYAFEYLDSLRYIVVNGDTAYRKADINATPVFDSSAPYYLDGRQNHITIVFPSGSISDSSHEVNLSVAITSPSYGQPVMGDTDAFFGFTTSIESSSSQSATMDITDSQQSYYSHALDRGSGTFDVPADQMRLFRGSTITATLHLLEATSNYSYSYSSAFHLSRRIVLERAVTFLLR